MSDEEPDQADDCGQDDEPDQPDECDQNEEPQDECLADEPEESSEKCEDESNHNENSEHSCGNPDGDTDKSENGGSENEDSESEGSEDDEDSENEEDEEEESDDDEPSEDGNLEAAGAELNPVDLEENIEDDNNRDKRAWCYLDSENWENVPNTFGGRRFSSNPVFGPRMQLFCRTQWFLALHDENKVAGSQDEFDPNTFFELTAVGIPGHVRIQCLENKLYLGMKKSGRLYGEPDPSKENTVFIESMHNGYNNYLSRRWAHLGFFMALRKSGIVKKGPETAFGQKAIQFLPRRTNI